MLLYIKHIIKYLRPIRRNYMTKRRESKQGESKKREALKSKTPIKHKQTKREQPQKVKNRGQRSKEREIEQG